MKKKLMAILVFSGVLSIPSAVFAEASWYASLRAGVESSDGNLAVRDGASRWGIRGSAEAGEGLTAVYRFEHKITTPDAEQPGGRLSYVGLSGGFGTVTVGQIWNAAYNSTGAITDNSWYYGDAQTGYRHGSAVSYAFSNDLMSLQADAIYGDAQAKDPGMNDLHKTEFGLTVNVGDIGKVALSHTTKNFVLDEGATDGASDDSGWEIKTNTVVAEVSVSGLRVYAGSQTEDKTFIALENGATDLDDMEKKTTFFGFGGSLADAGLSYLFQWRDVKDSHEPWVLSLTRGLGDSASVVLEHGNNDGKSANKTQLGLVVSF